MFNFDLIVLDSAEGFQTMLAHSNCEQLGDFEHNDGLIIPGAADRLLFSYKWCMIIIKNFDSYILEKTSSQASELR